jgi:hypothetical protein
MGWRSLSDVQKKFRYRLGNNTSNSFNFEVEDLRCQVGFDWPVIRLYLAHIYYMHIPHSTGHFEESSIGLRG